MALHAVGRVCIAVAETLMPAPDFAAYVTDELDADAAAACCAPMSDVSLSVYAEDGVVVIEAEAVGGEQDGTHLIRFGIDAEAAEKLSASVSRAAALCDGD